MICVDCQAEEATEFHSEIGCKLKAGGYCVRCFERAVKRAFEDCTPSKTPYQLAVPFRLKRTRR